MTKVQFGWSMSLGFGKIERAVFMDAARKGLDLVADHFASVWLADHLQFGDRVLLEGWTELTYLAGMQPKLQYGHIVLCQLFRNPAHLAKMAATMQYMTQGNFILGLGAGWHQEECDAYGLPFPGPKQRVEELEEAVQIIKALWKGEKATFIGKYHSIKDAYCQPAPEPEPPIMIAGFQPKMMRLCARYADWWNGIGSDVTNYKKLLGDLDKACEEIGRDPASLKRTAVLGDIYCAPTEKEVQELMRDREIRPGTLSGTPEQISERIGQLVDLGISYFMLSGGGFPNLSALETILREVVPTFTKG
jgi:alkanesulfonate monooxygenase SsuD/methylene tetrahydromethanopterin reductase-like flavin-dependent oxidoreductase (luciferase family)